ncbi:tetratricopeptide repeat protein [Candidatus Vecturithrix granuli]|uniref:Tetratricopeptide repeat protein n=1 Tax=Vecturithrix granuli TaxID=1499967 RepID=A0A081C6I4_VECG1|nr:tetratricopeptide repeat protein [Candidatus Vecturithrix granuli]
MFRFLPTPHPSQEGNIGSCHCTNSPTMGIWVAQIPLLGGVRGGLKWRCDKSFQNNSPNLVIMVFCCLLPVVGSIMFGCCSAGDAASLTTESLLSYVQDTFHARIEFLGELLVRGGSNYLSQRRYQEALICFEWAFSLYQKIGDHKAQGNVLLHIGVLHFSRLRFEEARHYVERALKIANLQADRANAGIAMAYIGEILRSQGQLQQALELYQQALDEARELKDVIGEGRVLTNIGNVYVELGQYREAIRAFLNASHILEQAGDTQGVGIIHISLGVSYTRLGDDQRALTAFQRAQEILKTLRDQPNESVALTGMGGIYEDRGEYLKALGVYHQALRIQADPLHRAVTYNNMAKVWDRYCWESNNASHLREALELYQESLHITRDVGALTTQARTLNNIGEVYLHLSAYENFTGSLTQAETFLQQALRIQTASGDRSNAWKTLENLGYVYELQGKFDKALQTYHEAITLLDQMIVSAGVEELKRSLGAQTLTAYQRTIRLLCRSKAYQAAFDLSERARARELLDQLGNMPVTLSEGGDNELLQKETMLRSELTQLERLQRAQSLQSEDPELMLSLQRQIEIKRKAYEDLLLEIKLQQPEYAAMVRVSPLQLHEVQQLLDHQTTLVSYFMTEDMTIAFVITRNAFQAVELLIGEHELTRWVKEFRRVNAPPFSEQQSMQTLLEQGYAALISPLKPYLKTPIIGVIPHGVLHYIPFAALNDGQRYLNDDFTLFALPSVSLWQFVQGKSHRKSSSLLAFANNAVPGKAALHYAEQEVQALARIYRTHFLQGPEATESALKELAPRFPIIHLAAHAEMNPINPLFSRLFLSDDPVNDGALDVHEVYLLDLKKAELVVLSACDTQLGKQSRGDDMIGLNRAFLYADAASILASLWSVDDRATCDFMTIFYLYLKQGKSKAEALQIAQQITRAKYPQPYYWAAFVLTGDPGNTDTSLFWLDTTAIVLIIAETVMIILLFGGNLLIYFKKL